MSIKYLVNVVYNIYEVRLINLTVIDGRLLALRYLNSIAE